MKTLFAPGCALRKYKPELIERVNSFLSEAGLIDGMYLTCCKAEERLIEDVTLITCCPGCSHKFEAMYPNSQVISLWKVLLSTSFPFPNYHGQKMSIHDSCHARNRNSSEMQVSSRLLCERMCITLVEPTCTRDEARCCGGSLGTDFVKRKEMAISRAKEFSEKDVVVYCTGCVRSFSVTDVAPRHLLDLLFEEPTRGLYPPGMPTNEEK